MANNGRAHCNRKDGRHSCRPWREAATQPFQAHLADGARREPCATTRTTGMSTILAISVRSTTCLFAATFCAHIWIIPRAAQKPPWELIIGDVPLTDSVQRDAPLA